MSIDGGGIRGLIPLGVMSYMEKTMYQIAKDEKYLTDKTTEDSKKRERLHLTTFFDMLSGTSIGGIISACLAKPKAGSKEPEFYSDDAL